MTKWVGSFSPDSHRWLLLEPTGWGPLPAHTRQGPVGLCFGKSTQWEMLMSGTESIKTTLAENAGGANSRNGFAAQMLNYLRETVKL